VPAGAHFHDGRRPGEITSHGLWGYFPIGAAIVAADFSGTAPENRLDGVLAHVFLPNPYEPQGDWNLGLSANKRQNDGEDYQSGLGYSEPLATHGLMDNKLATAPILRAAPGHFIHPVHAMRLFLDKVGAITAEAFAIGRVKSNVLIDCDGGQRRDAYLEEAIPASRYPGLVQAIRGMGPGLLQRSISLKIPILTDSDHK